MCKEANFTVAAVAILAQHSSELLRVQPGLEDMVAVRTSSSQFTLFTLQTSQAVAANQWHHYMHDTRGP